MKRIYKNIIMLVLMGGLIAGAYFTMKMMPTSGGNMTQTQMQQPTDANQSTDGETPPEKPDESTQSSDSSSQGETPPEKPEGSSESTQTNDSSSMGSEGMTQLEQSQDSSKIVYYILLGVEGLGISVIGIYLVMSRFNKRGIKETFVNKDKIIIYVLSVCLLTGCLTQATIFASSRLGNSDSSNSMTQSETTVSATGATTVEDEQTLSDSYTSTNADESAILVQNGGNATISGTITKSGDSSNTENSEFYGINSGILVTKNSTATIKNATIETNAKGSNAVFSTGEDSKIYISDSTITTTGESSSRGLDATYGGYIEADNVTITTSGGSCATLATDRGEGTVKASNSTLTTNGTGSPVIYSTGDISITDTTGTANGSQMVVIEGKNSATVTDSTLTCSGQGNRNDVDNAGVMIYQSMSGDASEGTGTFTATNSSLTINSDSSYYKSAPMFFVTNTDAVINLENTTLSYGSNLLLSVKGTSEWGNSDSNGGDVEFNATKQTLTGDIELDKLSTLKLTLSSSSYTGTINSDNSAKEVSITLDKNSSITLTGDSYVTSLTDNGGTINLNGYKLYVNGELYNS